MGGGRNFNSASYSVPVLLGFCGTLGKLTGLHQDLGLYGAGSGLSPWVLTASQRAPT